ncbi:MAG: hypothetical protein JXA22_03825 [Candidatus Thermoplasmatota archaeon]|nr:hypothetical protein [Candidatus Thermoplasmatota archaeon]
MTPGKRRKTSKASWTRPNKLSLKDRALLGTILGDDEVRKRRDIIHGEMMSRSENVQDGDLVSIGTSDLELLFDLYDGRFFGSFFRERRDIPVDLKVSGRMTRAGGRAAPHRKDNGYTIALSGVLLERSFKDRDHPVRVNGLVCSDRLDAAMRIMEHEMLHVLEFVLFGRSSCSRPRFKELGRNLFGHTDTKHELVPHQTVAEPDLSPGDLVSFEHGGRRTVGRITRITRRATVMVEDEKGNLHLKFYVPIHLLTRAKPSNISQ